MKIYSPSATKQYLTCPVYWRLNRANWVSQEYTKLDAYGARGSGVSKALEMYNSTQDIPGSIEALRQEITREWTVRAVPQRAWGVPNKPEPTLEQMIQEGTDCFLAYAQAPMNHYDIIASEYEFKDHGRARADAIIRLRNGKVIPLDYKVKAKPYTVWIEHKIRNDFKNSWQLMHYCWALSEERGQLIDEYAILILWHDKKCSIEYVPYSFDAFRMEQWHRAATKAWSEMEEIEIGDAEPVEAATHEDKFGPCVYEEACLSMKRNPELMRGSYFQLERTKRG